MEMEEDDVQAEIQNVAEQRMDTDMHDYNVAVMQGVNGGTILGRPMYFVQHAAA